MEKQTVSGNNLSQTKIAFVAVQEGSMSKLTEALSLDADINHIDERGHTLLLAACKFNKKDMAMTMLSNPSLRHDLINQKNHRGEAALSCACYHGNQELVKKLLEIKGININIQDSNGRTPLHYAGIRKHAQIVALLIEEGASPVMRDKYGATLLQTHIISHPDLKAETIQKTMSIKDNDGNTQLHLLALSCADGVKKHCPWVETTRGMVTHFLELLFNYDTKSMWCRNNHNKLPIELAYETYTRLYRKYKKSRAYYLEDPLSGQEQALHAFLEFYANRMVHKPIIIASPCAAELNIETVIANSRVKDVKYYTSTIEFKDRCRQALRDNPNAVPELWRIHNLSYTPPSIIEENVSELQAN